LHLHATSVEHGGIERRSQLFMIERHHWPSYLRDVTAL
jgi:hypothetical protein